MNWIKIEDYIDNISHLKSYLMWPRDWGGPVVVSGNCSKEYLLEKYEAVCPIPPYKKSSTHNYGEMNKVGLCELKIGDKFYHPGTFSVYTVTNIEANTLYTDIYDEEFILDPDHDIIVERL